MFDLELFLKICKEHGVEPTKKFKGVKIIVDGEKISLDENLAVDLILKSSDSVISLGRGTGEYDLSSMNSDIFCAA